MVRYKEVWVLKGWQGTVAVGSKSTVYRIRKRLGYGDIYWTKRKVFKTLKPAKVVSSRLVSKKRR